MMNSKIKLPIDQARVELLRLDQTVRDVSDALCELDAGSASDTLDHLRTALAKANTDIHVELDKLNLDT